MERDTAIAGWEGIGVRPHGVVASVSVGSRLVMVGACQLRDSAPGFSYLTE